MTDPTTYRLTDEWRTSHGDHGAVNEAVRALREEAIELLATPGNAHGLGVELHFRLEVVRPELEADSADLPAAGEAPADLEQPHTGGVDLEALPVHPDVLAELRRRSPGSDDRYRGHPLTINDTAEPDVDVWVAWADAEVMRLAPGHGAAEG